MERLTVRDDEGLVALICRKGCKGGPACFECEQKAVDRLAAYEDTGLMPEDVTDLMAAHGTAIASLAEYRMKEEKQAPKCYSPDIGGGCRYLVPDGDDEPIDRCKKCPLCWGDKQRKPEDVNE